MGKLLSWVLIGVVVWAVWKFIVISQRKNDARQAARPPSPGGGPGRAIDGSGELMVRCDHCGIYLPQSESLARGEHRFCSSAHRDAGPRALARDADPH